MATQMEQDASAILQTLVEWSEQEDDPNFGNYEVSGSELEAKLSIPARRINDSVKLLYDRGLIDWLQTNGTAPYDFNRVWPSTEGRLTYQQALTQAEPSSSTPAYDVFLSHSSLDDSLAADVRALLEGNSITVFSTPGSVPTGSWEPQIEEALRNSGSIWVLLTPNALSESVWVHHEFGYFYGFNHGEGRDPEGHRCRFLYTEGTPLRGLYAWIQGTQLESFEDPVLVAETIATDLGKPFRLPPGWFSKAHPQQTMVAIRHPRIGQLGLAQTGNAFGPGTAEVAIELRSIDETVYYVTAITEHPDVSVEDVSVVDVVGPSHSRPSWGADWTSHTVPFSNGPAVPLSLLSKIL